MQIQNPDLAGAAIRLRYTRDEDGAPVEVLGDERGMFEVPDKDGEFLCATVGWAKARQAAPAPHQPAPPPVPVAPVAVAEPLEEPLEEPDTLEPEVIEIDLDALDKDELFALAAEQEIEGTSKRWGEERLRAYIADALGE